MKRSEEPRVGAFAACPFCGERKRLTLVTKRMRRGDGDRTVKLYEVDFKDGYSMVIMGRRKPTIDEACVSV